ncbi:hypothetical protein FE257_004495 [Aspergillus nanangensis]|uniref:NACHT domain-containing protein n=1 Tax=Aspergillus nanangensis TaxID=2582783 RepID=A0AAD4CY44_ASPNN|nr:hypothetical protein FE257_004495 [Aspergillus nanangensis]
MSYNKGNSNIHTLSDQQQPKSGPVRGSGEAIQSANSPSTQSTGNIDNISDGRSRLHRGIQPIRNVQQAVITANIQHAQGIEFTQNSSDGISQAMFAKKFSFNGPVRYSTYFIPSRMTRQSYAICVGMVLMSMYCIDNTSIYSDDGDAIPNWISSLSTLEFEKKHNSSTEIARQAPGSGAWFLESPQFIQWEDGTNNRLWCYGIPGVGKTILASIIVNHLKQNTFSSNAICIYAYFDHRDQNRHNVKSLLSSFLFQITQRRHWASPDIKQLYFDWKRSETVPTVDELFKIVNAQLRQYTRVFMVLDALDEWCGNSAEESTLDELLDLLGRLPSDLKFLFTSRNDRDIELKMQASDKIEIIARDEDIGAYIQRRIDRHTELSGIVKKGIDKDDQFATNMVDKIVNRSQGMFLLAQQHMNFLASKGTLEDLKIGLNNLPQGCHELYQRSLARINRQNDFKRTLAINVLMWLMFAERALTISELIHAVSIQVGDKALPEDRFPTPETLISACTGLVQIDETTKEVRLAHSTAEEYLQHTASNIFENAAAKMAEICLVYCSFGEFNEECDSEAEPLARYPFLTYAANHWGHHFAAGQMRKQTYALALEFLKSSTKVMTSFQFMRDSQFQSTEYITGLHVAAYFGADNLAKHLLHHGFKVNEQTSLDETPLHWAITHRKISCMHVLLNAGADSNTPDFAGRTPLHRAIRNNDTQSVEILLSFPQKPNLDLEDKQGWTALRWAARYGMVGIVHKLVRKGAALDAEDKVAWTALRWAASCGHGEIVRLLLEHGAAHGPFGSDRWTVLGWAAQAGLEEIISLLLLRRQQVDVNAADGEGFTALRGAVDYNQEMAAWLLLRQGNADINKADNRGFTPLHAAVQKWDENRDRTLVWMLLHHEGVLVNTVTKHGFTPLHIAATNGLDEVVWLLLRKGADLMRRDNSGRTALHCAVTGGHVQISRMLSQHAKDIVNVSDDQGQTALHVAASTGAGEMVACLVEQGVDIGLEDRDGWTALNRAISQGYDDIVSELRRNGAKGEV